MGQPTYSWTGPVAVTSPNTLSTNVITPSVTMVDTLNITTLCNQICGGTFPSNVSAAADCFNSGNYIKDAGEEEGHFGLEQNAASFITNCNPGGFTDHSTPSDYMLCVNGNKINVIGPFWIQCAQVCPHTTYIFTFWYRCMSINYTNGTPNQPQIQIEFDGENGCGGYTVEDPVIKPAIPLQPVGWCSGQWYQDTVMWNSDSANACLIQMTDLCTANAGNDFAIDDITFAAELTEKIPVAINPYPGPNEVITAADSTCLGSPVTFSVNGYSGDSVNATVTVPGGSITNLTHTMNGTTWVYTVTPTETGNVTFTITSVKVATHGCFFESNISKTVTVEPLPAITPGTATVCEGTTTASLPYTVTGGSPATYTLTWLGNAPAYNFINVTSPQTLANPLPIAVPPNPPTGSYNARLTVYNAFGCMQSYTVTVTVDPYPVGIGGPGSVCIGGSIQLTDANTGGTWTSENLSLASVSGSGVVTGGPGSGTVTIQYSLGGCAVTKSVTVDPLPTITPSIAAVCADQDSTSLSYTVNNAPTQYIIHWSAGALAAGFNNTGTLSLPASPFNIAVSNTAAAGTYTGRILVTNANGCSDSSNITVVIKPLPSAITGLSAVCDSQSISLSDATTGGIWSCAPAGLGSITNGGVLTGTNIGTITVTYTGPNGCKITAPVVIDPLPNPGTISGDSVCIGQTMILSDTAQNGIWSSSNSNVQITGTTTTTCTIYGQTLGTSVITDTITNIYGCKSHTSTLVTVDSNGIQPITGILGVCPGYPTPLSDGTPGGTWASLNPYVATIDNTGLVTGIHPGITTITYTVINACGTFVDSVTVVTNTPPYITTHFTLACQSLSDNGTGEVPIPDGQTHVLTDTSGCVKVCDSTVVRYYANGNYESVFTWAVTGGTIINNYGDSVDILWPAAGVAAQITIYDSLTGCISQRSICIDVIQKPHASYAVLPNTGQAVGPIHICVGTTELFQDLSTADPQSPIVSWLWNFGDGTGSSQQNPSHTFNTPGWEPVTLVVKNACGCTDTFHVVFHITDGTGPDIACASVTCQGDTTTYSTGSSCGTYNWSVIGGEITAGANTNAISVVWDNVNDTTGMGYVTLQEPCDACGTGTTIKVPVVLTSANIQGPDTICAGQQYVYSLPLWPATQYKWGLLGSTTDIQGVHDDHTVVIEIDTPGNYTLHGWYQNDITLCGANVFYKGIVVSPKVTITGDLTPCDYTTQTYTINGGDGGAYHWILSTPMGTTTQGDGSGTTFTTSFVTDPVSLPGIYVLTLTGGFCADPIEINVKPVPGMIDSISGPDTVCLNRVYTYIASSDSPGSIYNWQITGGTVTPASGSGTVTVTWTGAGGGTGDMTLSVNRVSVLAPYCPGPVKSIAVVQDGAGIHVTGDTLPCANAHRTYTANYNRGETYDWVITPNTAGSIVTGNHGPVIDVLWNNTPTAEPASIMLTVHKCDSTFTSTLAVDVQPDPAPAIAGPTVPICPGDTATFIASAGGATYTWNFGDGFPLVVTDTNFVQTTFPLNTTTSNEFYTVTVNITPNPLALCPTSGIAVMTVTVKPGPVAVASTTNYEITPPATTLLVGTVTNNVTGLTYEWDRNGVPIPGATNDTYTTDSLGYYFFAVVASNGCGAHAGVEITATPSTDTSAYGGGNEAGPCPLITTTEVRDCNTITMTASPTYSLPTWIATPSYVLTGSTTYTASATFTAPGIYQFVLTEQGTLCHDNTVTLVDTIGYVPDFNYTIKCGTGGMDTLELIDHTAYLPFWTIDSVQWFVNNYIILNIGNNANAVLAAPGTYVVNEVIHAFGPDGYTTCNKVRTITLPGQANALFTDSIGHICEDVAIYFAPVNTAAILNYSWSFGDGSGTLLQDPQRTYTWNPLQISNPNIDTVILTVTDTVGCMASDTNFVAIQRNLLAGALGPNQAVCANEAPITLAYLHGINTPSPTQYLWSNGATTPTISVNESGAYWVTVFDAYKCQGTFSEPAVQVDIIQTPPAIIYGLQEYCIGDVISLSGYAGTGVTYQWYRITGADTVSDGTGPAIADAGLPVGNYNYLLVLSETDSLTGITCSDTSAVFTAHMYGLPQPPTITGPTVIDCSLYHLQLTATAPVSGTFNWSDGTYGATDDIYAGGPYEVWFTNQYGCKSDTQVYVPQSPEYYFPYFATGCYTICNLQLPLTLYGPPTGEFYPWIWRDGGTNVETGTGMMNPYTVAAGGKYTWLLNNGLCTQQSGIMGITAKSCSNCHVGAANSTTLVCEPGNPASYELDVTVLSPADNTPFTIGTDEGPVSPYSGTFATSGYNTVALTFTLLPIQTPPDSLNVEITMTLPDGSTCFQKTKVAVPSCTWDQQERHTNPADSSHTGNTAQDNSSNGNLSMLTSSSLLVYPNPSSGNVSTQYDFGTSSYSERMVAVYDIVGHRIKYTVAPAAQGSWQINTAGWANGVYVIRMEADGTTLHTQRLVVSH